MELVTKLMVPNRKLVPLFRMAAVIKVIRYTGISAYVVEVKSSTDTITTPASNRITTMSLLRSSASRSS